MVVGMFFSMAGSKPVAFISTSDIGYFAAQALLNPTDSRYANRKIDLAAGAYDINDVSRAIEKSQGYTPWFARYAPKAVRNLLPHDFKEMMKCESGRVKDPIHHVIDERTTHILLVFESPGYPAANVQELREIYPDLTDFEAYFKGSK